MSKRRLVRAAAVFSGLALVLAACGDDDEGTTDEPSTTEETSGSSETTSGSGGEGGATCDEGLKLAFFGAQTGEAANLGINISNGAQLAIDQFNEANPDCQIGLEIFDSQGDPAQAPALAQEVIADEGIVGIIGPAFSGESRQANPIFEEAGVPLVTASATGVDLSDSGWDVFHRALANDGAQGPAIATYISGTLGAANVAVIDDASEYGLGLADIVATELEGAGVTITTRESIDPEATDFSSTVNTISGNAPDVVFYGGYYEEAGQLAKQLSDAGVEAAFVSGDGALDPGFIENAGDAAEGVVLTCPCAPSPADFVAAYEEAFGQAPGTYSPEAYDAANLFLTGITEGNADRESLNTYLDEVEYEGITKTFTFDDTGEVETLAIYAYAVTADGIPTEAEIIE
jgi:branched-chain amino acid transport system substrate-binding protein